MPNNPPAGRWRPRLRRRLKQRLDQLRYSVSFVEALPQLTLLGLIVGVLTAAIIVLFRVVIEVATDRLLPTGAADFENLSAPARAALIGAGLILTYLVLLIAGPRAQQVSVGHVLDRLHNHQGHMPLANWLVQFIGGAVAVISGQSVGREGPAVHLGAGVASFFGRSLRLPNNSRFSLMACGVAAAIAASFDTPMAGVIFAMEVIVMEYTIAGFLPVIIAAVSGTVISRAVFPNPVPLFDQVAQLGSLAELPYFALMALLLGAAATLFIRLNLLALSRGAWPLWLRLALAGGLTAAVAYPLPAVMGLGYDTLDAAVNGSLPLTQLILIAVAKLVLSALVLGLGVPGGIIGPTLVTGACIGGAMGIGATLLLPIPTAEPGFYVIIGMAGFMAAVLNAPLAALVAVLELCYNPHMIFPAMLVIVIANVTVRSGFHQKGIFIEQLRASGRALEFRPARQALMRAGLGAVMVRNLVYARPSLDYDSARALLKSKPDWIVVDFTEAETRDKLALPAADLANYLDAAPVEVLDLSQPVELLEIPARRLTLAPIHETATLWEALQAMRASGAEGLYSAQHTSPLAAAITGIVTQQAINSFYQA